MAFAEILKEILFEGLTTKSRVNALATLRILALDADYEAIRALSQTLAHELDCDIPASSFINACSLPELLSAADIPPLLRVYAAGFSHRDFINNFGKVSQLAAAAVQSVLPDKEEIFSRFQHLVRRGSPLQDEALRAYVLAHLVSFANSMPLLYSSPANLLPTLYQIQTECRIVPGREAESGLTFGRELIIDLPNVGALLFILSHEEGHRLQRLIFGSRVPGTAIGQTEQQFSTDQRPFQELARSLSELLEAPQQGASQHVQPNRVVLSSGVMILCSYETLPLGQYIHLSLSDRGLGIDLRRAAVYAYFVLLLLDVDLDKVAVFYSPLGRFHFGFPGTGPTIDLLKRKVRMLTMEPAIESARTKSAPWLDELEKSGRLVWAEADFGVALGLGTRRPVYYITPPPEATWHDLTACRQLRANGTSTTTRDQLNHLLCSAVRCADVPVLRAVLEAGAAANACTGDSEPCVLQAGTSFCIIDDGKQKTYYGPTASDILAVVDTLHAFGLSLDGPIDYEENTLLINAVGRSLQLTQFLLAHGASPNQPNRRGETPLLIAASVGPTEVVEVLLHYAADVTESDSRGKTALHVAAQRGSVAIVRRLLQAGATVDAALPDGTTPLMQAAEQGLPDVIKALLEGGADPSATTSLGRTALHSAVLSLKAQAFSAPPLTFTDQEMRLGYLAYMAQGQRDCIRALLEAGADIDEETNKGETPLIFASTLEEIEMVKMLIACGANVHARTVDGTTALMLASEQVIPILARAGADLNAADDLGFTALHAATRDSDSTRVKVLLELGANVNVRTRGGLTPLALAAAQAHPDLVRMLIAAGADVNMADNEGNTPLHLALGASSKGTLHLWHTEDSPSPGKTRGIVELLVQSGADITRPNLVGDSPLALAKGKGLRKDIPLDDEQGSGSRGDRLQSI